MIKLKKPKKTTTPKRTVMFIYKHLDVDYTLDCTKVFNLRYNGTEGFVEFQPQEWVGPLEWSTSHKIEQLFNATPFYNNAILFLMFRINAVKVEVHSTYEPDLYTSPYPLGHFIYGLRFYPTDDTLQLNPFKVLEDPRTMIVTTKKPFHSQEIVFPKQYIYSSNAKGFGRWLAIDMFNVFTYIKATLQVATQYQGFWTSNIPIGVLTFTVNVSFREPKLGSTNP